MYASNVRTKEMLGQGQRPKLCVRLLVGFPELPRSYPDSRVFLPELGLVTEWASLPGVDLVPDIKHLQKVAEVAG